MRYSITTLIWFFITIYVCFGQLPSFNTSMNTVSAIPLPEGYERVSVDQHSFAGYLRTLPLRKNKTVYLYNRQPKPNQSLHYAVIDISTGDKDLQQCADAIMRLRAEYFYDRNLYDSILFLKDGHTVYQFSHVCKVSNSESRNLFMHFMETVFINCGTYTLDQQLKPVKDFSSIQMGDVLIKAGAPGHTEIVIDMAVQKQTGKKIYLLAQGYMPAQDIHILLNLQNTKMGPWYEVDSKNEILTASWIFTKNQLKRW
jgi:hypothetical protein